jgi:hypothetical protein
MGITEYIFITCAILSIVLLIIVGIKEKWHILKVIIYLPLFIMLSPFMIVIILFFFIEPIFDWLDI